MIFDALIDLVKAAVLRLIDALPEIPPPPAWLVDGVDAVSGVYDYATSLRNWVAVDVFVPIVLAVVACLVVGIGIKVARIVASFLTLGGGGAG